MAGCLLGAGRTKSLRWQNWNDSARDTGGDLPPCFKEISGFSGHLSHAPMIRGVRLSSSKMWRKNTAWCWLTRSSSEQLVIVLAKCRVLFCFMSTLLLKQDCKTDMSRVECESLHIRICMLPLHQATNRGRVWVLVDRLPRACCCSLPTYTPHALRDFSTPWKDMMKHSVLAPTMGMAMLCDMSRRMFPRRGSETRSGAWSSSFAALSQM